MEKLSIKSVFERAKEVFDSGIVFVGKNVALINITPQQSEVKAFYDSKYGNTNNVMPSRETSNYLQCQGEYFDKEREKAIILQVAFGLTNPNEILSTELFTFTHAGAKLFSYANVTLNYDLCKDELLKEEPINGQSTKIVSVFKNRYLIHFLHGFEGFVSGDYCRLGMISMYVWQLKTILKDLKGLHTISGVYEESKNNVESNFSFILNANETTIGVDSYKATIRLIEKFTMIGGYETNIAYLDIKNVELLISFLEGFKEYEIVSITIKGGLFTISLKDVSLELMGKILDCNS